MKKNTGSANTPSFRWKTSKNPSAHGSTETYFAVTVIDRETGRNRYPGSDIKTVSRNPHPGNTIPLLRKTQYSFLSQQVRISSRRVLPVWPQSPSPARRKSRRPSHKNGKKLFQIRKTTNKPAPPTSPASKWRFPDIPPFLPAGTETDIPLPARTCMKKRCDSSTRPAGRPSSRQNPVSRIPPTPAGHSFPEIPHNAETHGNRVRPKRTNPARQPGCRLQPAFSGKERHHVSRQ